eukprot:1065206-Alexandrium_andersonii.AAC.1
MHDRGGRGDRGPDELLGGPLVGGHVRQDGVVLPLPREGVVERLASLAERAASSTTCERPPRFSAGRA